MLVCINRCENYDQQKLDELIRDQLDKLHLSQRLHPDMKVLIKPNLLQASPPEKCATTHPAVILAVARYVRSHGVSNIVVADSPGGIYTAGAMARTYKICGYESLKEVAQLNFDTTSANRNGYTLLTPVLNADLIINCCKLKTHALAIMTAGVKNIFGCIPGLKKPQVHCVRSSADSFSRFLIGLNDEVSPDITVLDAIDCMEGNGPGGGTPRHAGYILSSASQYALDEKAAQLMGISPRMCPVIRAARAAGKINETIELSGDPLVPVEPPFKLPDAVTKDHVSLKPLHVFRRLFGKNQTYPQVNKSKCIGCGKCAESCPKHLITIIDHKANMTRKGCISCYCCQEMCPANAIDAVKH